MKSYITEPLGLYGYKNSEPVILAALANEGPLLILGKHGTGKSMLIEKIAGALNISSRLYNASLINYDDLVGMPYPSEDKKSLKYIYDDSAIWDAEFVLIDEINRTKPELQNKLFPIINEKRVQGKKLEKLIYRWSAMNPPFESEESDEGDEFIYSGTSRLDEALADRFYYFLDAPEYEGLSEEEQNKAILCEANSSNSIPLQRLIDETKERVLNLSNVVKTTLFEFTKQSAILLKEKLGYLSIRRIARLYECSLYIHAAREVLESQEKTKITAKVQDSFFIALNNCLPYKVNHEFTSSRLYTIFNQALELVNSGDDLSELYKIPTKEERVIYALKNKDNLSGADIAKVLPSGIGSLKDKKRRALALMSYLTLKDKADIPAVEMKAVVEQSSPALTPGVYSYMLDGSEIEISKAYDAAVKDYDGRFKHEFENLLNSFLPTGYKEPYELTELARYFQSLERRIYG